MSHLRNHKKHHNIADTSVEICGCNQDIEVAISYLHVLVL